MTQWEHMWRWLRGLVLVGLVGLLASCEQPGGEGCGGIEDLVSCVSITRIIPEGSSNVDAFQNPDCDGDPTTNDPEEFIDHNATITFSNTTFPGATRSFAVTLRSVTISYGINNCPRDANCPPLPVVGPLPVSFSIPADSSRDGVFPFVPLRVKQDYRDQMGSEFPPPSYSVTYTFTGQTQFFRDTITVSGSAEFTIGNFNLCE